MIRQYWKFLLWLASANLYYLAVFTHIIVVTIGIIVFGIAFPFVWLYARLEDGFIWVKYHVGSGLKELKKGKQ